MVVKVNDAQRVLYVLNSGDGTVGVFDLESRQLTHSLPVGEDPTAIVLDRGLKRIYVTCEKSSTLWSYTWPAYDDRVYVEVGSTPGTLAIHAATHRVYIVCRNDWMMGETGTVAVVDGTDLAVLGHIGVNKNPSAIVVAQDLNMVFVANSYSDNLSVIDGDMMKLTGSLRVGATPLALAIYEPASRLLSVNAYGSKSETGSVSVIDMNLAIQIEQIDVGGWPTAIAIDTQTSVAYVTNALGASLSLLGNLDQKLSREDVPLGIEPGAISLDMKSGNLIIGSSNGVVSVVRENLSFQSKMVGDYIVSVAADERRGLIYCTDYWTNNMFILDENDLDIVRSIPMGIAPKDILVVGDQNKAFIANSGDWILSVINLDSFSRKDIFHWDFRPTRMALCGDSNLLYVISDSSVEDDSLVVINTVSGTIIQEILSPGTWGDLTEIAVDSERQLVYALNSAETETTNPGVSVLECGSDNIMTTVGLGKYPIDMVIRESDGSIYISNYVDDTVSIVGPDHNVIDTIDVGSKPRFVAHDSALDILYVLNSGDKSLWTFDTIDLTLLSVVNVGNLRQQTVFPIVDDQDGLLVNPQTHQVWVIDTRQGGIFLFPSNELTGR